MSVAERVYDAVLTCAGRDAFRFSVEDVAREAGVSRATVYRHFPGGKDQLVAEALAFEVGRFFTKVHEAVTTAPDLAGQIEQALFQGHRLLEEHEVLRTLLREDPEHFLAELDALMTPVEAGIEAYVATLLGREELAPGVDVAEAAEYVARMYLTYLGHGGQWDLTDRSQVRRLVAMQFVGGILRR